MTRPGPQHQVVEPIDQPPVGRVERRAVESLPVLAQLDGIPKQLNQRLDERPHRLPGEFLAQSGQLAEQMDQAALLGAVQAVVRRVEIADQRPGERFPQDPDEDIATAVAVDEEQRQARVAEAPGPGGLAVDPPAGLVPLDHGGLTEQFQEFVDHWGEELTSPAEVTEQAGSADGQAEEVVEQVAGLAQGDAEVGAAVAGEQAGARADVGAGEFQVAAALAGPLTGPAAVDVPPVTMPLELGFGQIGHDVVLEPAGGFEVAGAAMRALLGADVVFDEDSAGRGLGPKRCRVVTMFLTSAVGAWAVGFVAAVG